MSSADELLWERYRADRRPEDRARILSQHVGLVHHVVRQIANRVGDALAYDDLISAGSIGLVLAFEAFDPSRGAAFTTYATQRIRGTVLDELRAADWRSRLVRTRGRQVQVAETQLERALGRRPTAEEVARALDIDVESYWSWRTDAEGGSTVTLDAAASVADRGGATLADVIPDRSTPAPDAELLRKERAAKIQSGIATLPEQQRIVIALCYFEELTLRQIAEVLHVTESRISQIRTAALRALREHLADEAFE